MGENILSQDEVNALLRGIAGGEVETAPPPSSAETTGAKSRDYNIASQERVIRGRMPTLDIVNERFARFSRSVSPPPFAKPPNFLPSPQK